MRKEFIWAISFGLILGLIITFGVIKINKSINNNYPSKTPQPKGQTSGNKIQSKIAISSPSNLDLFTEDTVKVEGITLKNSPVVISTSDKDVLVTSEAQGVFTTDVDLIGGINNIQISVVSSEETSSLPLTLAYSSSFEKREVNNNQASSESEIREKIQQKINNILSKPKAFVGVVTDISTDNLQIKNSEDQIKQVVIDPNVISIVKNESGKSKVVKYSDIAIGDTILAMGYQSSDIELDAQRILVNPENEKPELTIKEVVFSEIPTKDITKTTKVINAKLSDIEDDQKVITVYEQGEKTLTLRTLFALTAK